MHYYTIARPEVFRANMAQKLAKMIDIGEVDLDELTKLGNIEKGIYNYAIREANRRNIVKKWDNQSFVHLYMDRLRSVYINLKQPALVEKIRQKDILPEQVAFMSHHEMNPDIWKDIIERKMMRDASKLNCNIQASTDMYTCSRCKSKKTIYYEMATRSADEQMTIFITCLDCGKNWKR
jgi:DNA-directed RNA polymerase subunit M/transcription elongation factor TFIIS